MPTSRARSNGAKAASTKAGRAVEPARDEDVAALAAHRRPAKLNLDAMEREGAPSEPFDFELGGRVFLMSDPKEVDWQDLLVALGNPVMFFRLVMATDDQAAFFQTKLPAWKLNKLIEEYQTHYGLPSGPNAGGLPR